MKPFEKYFDQEDMTMKNEAKELDFNEMNTKIRKLTNEDLDRISGGDGGYEPKLDPSTFPKCPKCGSRCLPGCEVKGGELVFNGIWYCTNSYCGYCSDGSTRIIH